jgi:hypothetical protein
MTQQTRKRSLTYPEWQSLMFSAGWRQVAENGRAVWQYDKPRSSDSIRINTATANAHWFAGTTPGVSHEKS